MWNWKKNLLLVKCTHYQFTGIYNHDQFQSTSIYCSADLEAGLSSDLLTIESYEYVADLSGAGTDFFFSALSSE